MRKLLIILLLAGCAVPMPIHKLYPYEVPITVNPTDRDVCAEQAHRKVETTWGIGIPYKLGILTARVAKIYEMEMRECLQGKGYALPQ